MKRILLVMICLTFSMFVVSMFVGCEDVSMNANSANITDTQEKALESGTVCHNYGDAKKLVNIFHSLYLEEQVKDVPAPYSDLLPYYYPLDWYFLYMDVYVIVYRERIGVCTVWEDGWVVEVLPNN